MGTYDKTWSCLKKINYKRGKRISKFAEKVYTNFSVKKEN